MLVKIATFFLIGMAVLAMFGRLRWPGGARGLPRPRTCQDCGRISVTGGACRHCNDNDKGRG